MAKEDIEELKRHPLAADKHLGVVLAALRWAHGTRTDDPIGATTESIALAEDIGVETVRALLGDVARAAGLKQSGVMLPNKPGQTSGDDILDALLWGNRLRCFLSLDYRFPRNWNLANLASAITKRGHSLSGEELGFLTHLATNVDERNLRFAVSGVGLASGQNTARYLFLRALTMDRWIHRYRCRACWYYAAALSTQGSDPALRTKMRNQASREIWRSPEDADEMLDATALVFGQEDVAELVLQELNSPKVPKGRGDDRHEGPYRYLPAECDCARCRRMRELEAEEPNEEFGKHWEEEEEEEFDESWDGDEDGDDGYPYEDDPPSYREEPRWVETPERRDRARSERKRQSLHKKKQKKLQKKKKKKKKR